MAGEGSRLADETQRRLFWAGALANGAGALLAGTFFTFLIPLMDDPDAIWEYVTPAFAAYLPFSLWAGTKLTRRPHGLVFGWLRAERPPLAKEREAVLRQPLHQAKVSISLWVVAALLFGSLTAIVSIGLGVMICVLTLLGGMFTAALTYLRVERALRPVTAHALAGSVPDSAYALGVGRRLIMAWVLSAGVSLLSLGALAVAGVTVDDLDGDGLTPATLFLVGIGIGNGLLFTVLTARSVADPLVQVRSALDRVARGQFDVRVPVDDGSEIGFLEAGFNRMAEGLAERERLREAFGTFVDPGLTERVLQEGTDLAGEEVELSVLFLDVRGFTTYSERVGAHEVVATLNALYGEVVPVIAKHGGHANKFIGDGLLAVFGAPQRLPDHAERAVAAACEIASCVNERFGDELQVGVGVNSGPVVAGTIGGGGRLDFTVIGDVVNTAARVESATRETGDDVLITDATLALLRDGEAWEGRPRVELKGKTRDVRLYAPAKVAAER